MVDVPRRASILKSNPEPRGRTQSIDAHDGPLTPSSFKRIGRLMYRITNENHGESSHAKGIPKLVIFLNAVLGPLIGVCIAVRATYDGRVSLIGITLRVFYFVLFGIAIYLDARFEPVERFSRLIPKVCGILFIAIQFLGVVPNYDCDTKNWISCL